MEKNYLILILIIVIIICSATLLSITVLKEDSMTNTNNNTINSTNTTDNITNTSTNTDTHNQATNHKSSSKSDSHDNYNPDDPLSVEGMGDFEYTRSQPTRDVNGHHYKLMYDDNGHPDYWYQIN